jgi:RNA polymerase sigma-70 factor (ECF subfamily)
MSNEPKNFKDQEFKEIVLRYQAYLRAFIHSLGVAPTWVDDIAQEVFIVAYNKFDEFDPQKGNWGNWLWGIARNLIQNELHKSARHTRIINNSLTEVLLEKSSQSFVDKIHEKEVFATMIDCIEKLPAKSRDLFKKRYQQQENATELAQQIASTAEAVRQMLLKIRRTVQTCMKKALGEVAL